MNGDTWELWREATGEEDGGFPRRLAHLEERPAYCNRGRWIARIDYDVAISSSDPWPRYYFDLAFGRMEVKAWLEAHKVKVPVKFGWTFVPAPPGTIDMDALVNGGVKRSE